MNDKCPKTWAYRGPSKKQIEAMERAAFLRKLRKSKY